MGSLKVSLVGPKEARVTCRDNGDGTHRVEYLPNVRGLYEVSVLYGESHVPGIVMFLHYNNFRFSLN